MLLMKVSLTFNSNMYHIIVCTGMCYFLSLIIIIFCLGKFLIVDAVGSASGIGLNTLLTLSGIAN